MPRTFQFSHAQLDAYGIAELHKLEEVLRRDDYFALRAVAETIGRKIGSTPQAHDARPFLTAYYGDLRAISSESCCWASERQTSISGRWRGLEAMQVKISDTERIQILSARFRQQYLGVGKN